MSKMEINVEDGIYLVYNMAANVGRDVARFKGHANASEEPTAKVYWETRWENRVTEFRELLERVLENPSEVNGALEAMDRAEQNEKSTWNWRYGD